MSRLLAFALLYFAAAPLAAQPIRAVMVPPIPEPIYSIVSSSASLGQYDSRTFVPEGAARESFAEAMARQDLRLGAELHHEIEKALSLANIGIAGNGAALAVAFAPGGVRYSDAELGDDFAPSYAVIVRLMVKNAPQAEIRIAYGGGDTSARRLFPDARYRFTSPDAILSEPLAAAEGLRAGLAPIAAEIATLVSALRVP